ncbi:MAG: zinc ribbon domain-containing protein [Eubacterium sp.]
MAKYCPNCYVGIADDDTVCENCGAVLKPNTVNEPRKDDADAVIAAMFDKTTCGESEEAITDIATTEVIEEKAADGTEWKERKTDNVQAQQSQEKAKVLSLGDWLVTLLLVCIPVVNLVMLIYWSAGNDIDPNKKNYARAQLIIMAIGIVLSFFFFGSVMALIFTLVGSYY